MKKAKIEGGIAGKILRIDLDSNEIWTEDTENYAKRFIGGRMINSYILLNETSTGTRWSDHENPLIFGVGCLVGTLAPGANRVSIETISPYNNGKGSANFGGYFGAELKYAGFDHIVVKGKSEKPVYLWIHDGNAELRDAKSVWGKTTYETEAILRDELGDNQVQVASIGPAGENMVRGSIVFTNPGKVAGGSGVGCVMGVKKLKAIAVRGQGWIKVADPQRFILAVDKALSKIRISPSAKEFGLGIIEAVLKPESSAAWDFYVSARNGQDDGWPLDKRVRLTSKETGVPSYREKMVSCFACPIGCMPFYEITAGRYAGTKGVGYWINSASYSARLDLDDPEASIKYHLRCNQLGLDGDMCSVSLGWAFECFEKGLLTIQDTDGLELKWGDRNVILKMQEKLAYRDGIGDFLADGVKESARKLDKGSEDFAIHMKGQDSVDTYRSAKGWGFALSISPVGGRHLRGAVSRPEVMGPRGLRWSGTEYENIPEAVFWQARTKEIEDMSGLCIYVGTWAGAHALEVSDYAELISSAMGIDSTEEDLMRIARIGINLEKAFNTIHTDLDRKDDYPPKRYMDEPIKSGEHAGQKCDKEKWDVMLDEFYGLNSWDKESGLQTRKCLIELGLEDVAEKLDSLGKLK